MIKSDKQVYTIDQFNKWVVLRLRNLDPFNKHVGLVLTYIIEYSWINTTPTRHTNMNCHPYFTFTVSYFQLHPCSRPIKHTPTISIKIVRCRKKKITNKDSRILSIYKKWRILHSRALSESIHIRNAKCHMLLLFSIKA